MEMKVIIKAMNRKNGSEMVEASIVLPIIILLSMLMIRVMVFYMEILMTGSSLHRNLIFQERTDHGVIIRTSEKERRVDLVNRGILRFSPGKDIKASWYLINYDDTVRFKAAATSD